MLQLLKAVGIHTTQPKNVATYQHEIVINGARYKITVDGSKLVKVSGKLFVLLRGFLGDAITKEGLCTMKLKN